MEYQADGVGVGLLELSIGEQAIRALQKAHKEEEIDTANGSGFQTLVFAPVDHDFTAAFAQLDFDLSDSVKLVFAARVDESSLHSSQTSRPWKARSASSSAAARRWADSTSW